MPMTLEQIEQEIDHLPRDSRLMLFERMLAKVPVHPDLENKWAETAVRRAHEITSGKVKTRDVDEVLAEIEAEFDR